jgi:ADP-heptose:LPS heptosyltransferase
VEQFAGVARGLTRSHDAAIIVLGGPDEVERADLLTKLIGNEGRVLNLAGRTNIHETAAVIEQCDLFLGNDSGPMHISAAMNTPVVAVFGPSNKEAWSPYAPPGMESNHTIVSRDLPCQPCFYRAYSLGLREGCGPRPCLTGLSHGPVLEACRRAIDKRQE